MTMNLREQFEGGQPDTRLQWMNEPTRWQCSGGLELWTDSPTDFWQRTHYGFRVDNGHLLAAPVAGDFTMRCDVSFSPLHQYDQAGLMVSFSPESWLKCSVEYEPDESARLGCVVTNHGYSDWSTQDVGADLTRVQFEVRRAGADFHVAFALAGGGHWSQMRIAHLFAAEHDAAPQCGIYACSPQAAGYRALFHSLTIEEP